MATLDKIIPFLGLSLLCVFSQCGVSDITRSFDSSQANRLLSADTSKIWNLVMRIENGEEVFNDCIEDNTLTFINEATVDSLFVLGHEVTCGSVAMADTLYKAEYTLSANSEDVFLQVINLEEERHQTIGTMQVNELSSSHLKITYTVDDVTIEERYSY